MIKPPLFLETYRDSVLHSKLRYASALLKWASGWLAEVQDMSPDAAFDGLAQAKQVRRQAYGLEKAFEEAAVATMFHTSLPYHQGEGYTAVLRPGTDRKGWKHDKVMQALIESTQERLSERFSYVPEKVLRAIVTEAMWQVHKTGRIEWRATDLREAGIDPNLYSTRTPEDPSIDMRGEATYATTKTRPRGAGLGVRRA